MTPFEYMQENTWWIVLAFVAWCVLWAIRFQRESEAQRKVEALRAQRAKEAKRRDDEQIVFIAGIAIELRQRVREASYALWKSSTATRA